MKAIILAGGKGRRLEPYTTILPKPLMPIGDVPILEVVIRQLSKHGFKEITLAVGHLAELLIAYFNDGSKYGVEIEYLKEQTPLGTAGPLKQVSNLESTFLVMNGDVLTTLDYSKLITFHQQRRAIATIAMHKRSVEVDFGVMKVDKDNIVIGYDEKPTLGYLVSMGIYVFEPEVLDYIEPTEKLDFPDLVKHLLKSGEEVQGYPSEDYWLDIGRPDDYEKAIRDFEKMKNIFI